MITGQGQYESWTTFIIETNNRYEIVDWCHDNFGRKFFGFMNTAFKWRLSNWGRWNYEFRSFHEIGLQPQYVRIFLRKPEDIVLFVMRWS